MKNFKTFFCCLAGTLALASCSKDRNDAYSNPSLSSIEIIPLTCPVTKAPIIGTVFPERSMIVAAYYYSPGGNYDETFFSNVVFSKNGTTWTGDKYWPLTGELDFLAYSCPSLNPNASYTGTKVTDEVTLAISDNSSVQEDILFAYAERTNKISSVSMNFKHAQAMISFKAKSNLNYNAETNTGITITNITLNGAKYSGTCVMKNDGSCDWSLLGSQADKPVPGFSPVNLTSSYSAQLGTGILVPEQDCTSITITYTLHNGKQGNSNLDNAGLVHTVNLSSPDTSWVQGKNYCYQINITQTGISVSPSVTDWVTVNPDTVNIS